MKFLMLMTLMLLLVLEENPAAC